MCTRDGVRIVLLSSFPVVRAGLRYLLDGHNDLHVVGDTASIQDAVGLIEREHADMVVIDPDSREVSLTAISTVSEACDSRIIVLTCDSDPATYTTAIELGASGVITKEHAAPLIVRAIEKVHAGEMWLDRDKTAKVLLHAMRGIRDPELIKIESLTNREREIVALVAEGLSNAVIGERLFISDTTVRNHLTSILGKLGLVNRFELAVYAFRHHLASGTASFTTAHPPSARTSVRTHGASRRAAALAAMPSGDDD